MRKNRGARARRTRVAAARERGQAQVGCTRAMESIRVRSDPGSPNARDGPPIATSRTTRDDALLGTDAVIAGGRTYARVGVARGPTKPSCGIASRLHSRVRLHSLASSATAAARRRISLRARRAASASMCSAESSDAEASMGVLGERFGVLSSEVGAGAAGGGWPRRREAGWQCADRRARCASRGEAARHISPCVRGGRGTSPRGSRCLS
ncbi:hypothetical protein B0H10DRAFT_662684 [Mycena sp. CBHHK59/15]|nr:hypothetical protein B0H10DRAFT_662684 [Mycena sp. CBHHK59/15]